MPIVTVAPEGGDYTTITAALAAILDAGPDNIYTIQVAAGTYDEDGSAGFGLELQDYVNIEGADRDTVIIRSNGGGADKDAIWAIAKCLVSNCTIRAQATDHYAVHIDRLCDWFSMENVIVRHDDPARPAIAAGGRAGQVINLTDITITQGTFSIHGDVYSRAATSRIWQWNLLRVSAPSLSLTDFIEYKDNRVNLQDCTISAITYVRDLTYYNANPEDPLFNQGYVRPGIFLYDRHGNTIGSIAGNGMLLEEHAQTGRKIISLAGYAERLHPYMEIGGSLTVKALPTNTGKVYLGCVNGDVTSSNGMPLSAGDLATFVNVGNLNQLWLDAATDGEGVAWQILSY